MENPRVDPSISYVVLSWCFRDSKSEKGDRSRVTKNVNSYQATKRAQGVKFAFAADWWIIER